MLLTGYINRSTLLTLAKHATTIGAYKTARYAYDQLQVITYTCTLYTCMCAYTVQVKHAVLYGLYSTWEIVSLHCYDNFETCPSGPK